MYSCSQHRDEAFRRLAGELSALEQERFDRHQRGCEACQQLLHSLEHSMVAAHKEPEPLQMGEKDRLYAAIAERATRARAPEAPATRRAAPQRRWRWIAAGATAFALALAFVAVRLRPNDAETSASALVDTSVMSGLDVRAAAGTAWRMEGEAPDAVLLLERGEIYVRYEKQSADRSLTVRAPGLMATVIGTIFVVRTDGLESEVGVIRGMVRVAPDRGDVAVLSAAQRRLTSGRIESIHAADLARVADWLAQPTNAVSVSANGAEAHPPRSAEAALPAAEPPPAQEAARRPARPAARERRESASAADPDYAEAERALAAGNPGAAADVLERIVQSRPDAAEADTARLELARLYAGPLARREAALGHLRAFLSRRPTGAGAGAARALLCRLAPEEVACITARPPSDQ